MDAHGDVLPEGMPEVASAGPEQFYANTHHSFLYGSNDAIKYSMPPAYPNEFTFASQVDATSLPFTHQSQQTHQLQFSNQPYATQTVIRSPLPENAQPSFGDPYATQHSRQHVRQSPSTISPAQLQPQAQQPYHQPWDELTQFSNGIDHQPQGLRQQTTTASTIPNLPAASIDPHTLAPPASSNWLLADGTSFSPNQPVNNIPFAPATYLAGCYWATVDIESTIPEKWAESIQHFWRQKIEEASKQPTKSQKRPSSQAVPSSPIDLSGDSNPSKRAKVEKIAKAVSTKKTITKPLPADPIERLKESVTRLFKNPDLSDPAKFSLKFWELMQEAGTDPERRLVLIKTATKEGSPEIWRTFARNITVPGRLQQWIAQIWNSDKASPLLPLCMRIIRQLNLSTTELQASSLYKTITFLSRKKTYPTIAELADQILSQAENLEQQNIANGTGGSEQSAETVDKSLSTKPNIPTNAGMKRNRDDADNGGKTEGAVKKPSMAPVKTTTTVATVKAVVPTAIKPTTAVMPTAVPVPTAPTAPTAPTTTASPPTTTTTTVAKPKPTTSTSSFFKSMTSLGAGTRPVPKATTTTPTPPPKTQGYSSIFDQLRERQKKDEEEAALRAKGGKVAEKEEEVTKKGKKKKTVRWKPDNLLAEVTLFQVLEPIGEYYGGGDGKGHVFGDARSLDVEEGKDALAALKNRKALEDEDDIYIDWYQPIAIDFSELHSSPDYDASTMSIRRGGTKAVESKQVEEQTKRETGILSVQYNTVREIPPSPEEPAEQAVDGASGEWKEIPVPDNLRVEIQNSMVPQQLHQQSTVPAFDLSSILSQIQQPQMAQPAPQPTPAPIDSIAAILAQVQALGAGSQATQSQPQAPATTTAPPSLPESTQPNLLAILSTLTAANQQQQPPQPQKVVAPPPLAAPAVPDLAQIWMQLSQQQQQAQQQQQQVQQQPQTLADLIGTLTGQQKPATPNQLAYTGFSASAQMNPTAMWNQYASAAAAWSAAASQNNTPANPPDTTNVPEEPGRLSGKDIRERLREQVGWTEPLFDDETSVPSSGRDGHGRDGNAGGGKNWKKDKWAKKNKKNKNNKFGGGGGSGGGGGGGGSGGDHQHQGENVGNGNAGGGARNGGMCKYFSKGLCQMGNSCKFSHPEDGAGDGGAKVGGGGRSGWKEKKRGGHGGHGGHGGGHHGPRGGNLDAEAGRSEWVEGLEY